jgi:ApbE superfamily uncharacterized protein (UPF0280 family)
VVEHSNYAVELFVFARRWEYKETRILVKANTKRAVEVALKAAFEARMSVEKYVLKYPEFRYSLEPVKLRGPHPEVIRLMLEASELAGVGPFASVAGAIAQVACEAGVVYCEGGGILVENGGDIQIMGRGKFRIGVYAGNSPLSGKIAFLVKEEELPAGICTSSGTVGPSLSFGESDATIVIADEASLADAAATAIGNEVRGREEEESIKRGLDKFEQIPDLRGCLIIRGKMAGLKGRLPEIVLSRLESLKEFLQFV